MLVGPVHISAFDVCCHAIRQQNKHPNTRNNSTVESTTIRKFALHAVNRWVDRCLFVHRLLASVARKEVQKNSTIEKKPKKEKVISNCGQIAGLSWKWLKIEKFLKSSVFRLRSLKKSANNKIHRFILYRDSEISTKNILWYALRAVTIWFGFVILFRKHYSGIKLNPIGKQKKKKQKLRCVDSNREFPPGEREKLGLFLHGEIRSFSFFVVWFCD